MSVHAPGVDDPSNWVEAKDQASGRPYWINKSTNETSWNPPQTVNTEGDGEEWEEVIDESTGRAYFVNSTSRRATWSRPEHQQLMVQERFFEEKSSDCKCWPNNTNGWKVYTGQQTTNQTIVESYESPS